MADWLSKFHTWPEPIRALWLVMIPVTLLGITRIVMRGLRDILHAARPDQGATGSMASITTRRPAT